MLCCHNYTIYVSHAYHHPVATSLHAPEDVVDTLAIIDYYNWLNDYDPIAAAPLHAPDDVVDFESPTNPNQPILALDSGYSSTSFIAPERIGYIAYLSLRRETYIS